MKKLKILHALSQRPEMTGSGIYVEAIIKESGKSGFSNYRVAGVPADRFDPAKIVSPADGAYVIFESEPLNFAVPGMSDVMPYKSTLFRDLRGDRLVRYKAAFTRVLEAAVERFNPDIIHSNHLFLLSALVRKLFPNLPVVVTCHGTDLRQYHNCPQLRPFVKQYCQRLDRIIALTADQKTDIARVYDIPSDRIAVVGGGYDEKIFNRVPKQPAGTVQILYAGKFNLSKGVPWLLRSLMKIREHDWHLHLAGSGKGPEYRQCIDLAEQLGPKVTNHGYVSHQRLAELMKKAHIQAVSYTHLTLPTITSGCSSRGSPGR